MKNMNSAVDTDAQYKRQGDDVGKIQVSEGQDSRTTRASTDPDRINAFFSQDTTDLRRETQQSFSSTSSIQHHRIYPFGISLPRLNQAIRESGINASIVNRIDDAEAMMTLRPIFRRKPTQIRDAEDRGLPIYVLKHNTIVQMEQSLRALARGQAQFDPVATALAEAEEAISILNQSNESSTELAPQNAYIRRLQHELAERFELDSTSHGHDQHRRVRFHK